MLATITAADLTPRGSVRRASGFVLTGYTDTEESGNPTSGLPETLEVPTTPGQGFRPTTYQWKP
jgi:hypothetical protein